MGVLTSNEVKEISRRLAGMLRTATESNQLGSVSFWDAGNGSALDDITMDSSSYMYSQAKTFMIRISATGTPDSIRYSDDGGITWETETTITGASQQLGTTGIYVTFGATTGHTLGSTWTFGVCPGFAAEGLRSFIANTTDIDVQYKLVTPLYSLAKTPSNALTKYVSEIKSVMSAIASNLGQSIDAFYTANTLYGNAELVDQGVVTLSAQNVMPQPTILGVFDYSAEDTGTFTQGSSIDVSTYGAAKIELVALSTISEGTGPVNPTIATLDGLDFAGDPINKTVAVDLGGEVAQYTVVDLGYTERFRSVTGITVTGGSAGEKFMVRTKEDWKPLL